MVHLNKKHSICVVHSTNGAIYEHMSVHHTVISVPTTMSHIWLDLESICPFFERNLARIYIYIYISFVPDEKTCFSRDEFVSLGWETLHIVRQRETGICVL